MKRHLNSIVDGFFQGIGIITAVVILSVMIKWMEG